MKDFECEKSFIQDLFDGKHWYCIPNYQRPYVWETEQVEELLDCIKTAYENQEKQYFLGSIVYRKHEKTDSSGLPYTELELLDGQQRITTLFLVFASMRDVALENGSKIEYASEIATTCHELIYQEKKQFKNIPERLKIVFDIRRDVADFVDTSIKIKGSTSDEEKFAKLAENKKINTSIKHMANTVLVARHFFIEHLQNIGSYLQYLLNNVILVYISTEDLQDAFQLFTVMNNTGIKLSNSDILKANNLSEIADEKTQRKCAENWEEMESYFGEDFDNFLSQIRTILVKRQADFNLLKEFDDNVYSEKRWNKNLKQWEPCKALLKRGEETFAFIKEYFEVYQSIFDSDHYAETKSYAVANYLTLLQTGFETDYWKAPILMYFKKFKYSGFLDFIKKLDNKLSCDWIVGLVPSMRILNVNKILVCIDEKTDFEDILKSDVFKCNVPDFRAVVDNSVYGRKYAKYLLLKVDMLTGGDTTPYKLPSTISIEHILPQTPSAESQWVKDFSEEYRNEWTDKIGNLVLLSGRKNTSQGNYDYERKLTKYFEKKVETFPSIVKVFQTYFEWKQNDLENRQREVVSMLLKNFD